jgi:hypothetical protein
MTKTRQKYADTQHASTVGLLVLAIVFSPAVLVPSRPFGGASVSLAAVFSALCLVLAWFAWARDSRRPRMSVVTQPMPQV